MQKLYICPTKNSPEIIFSPEENIFLIRGTSSPEDVREMYYPVIEWTGIFIKDILHGKGAVYTPDNPLILKVDLDYFNSSSAKFLLDIFNEMKMLNSAKIPFIIEWHYDEQDIDMFDAGQDMALLVETEFNYIIKTR
jgi:hypothetical protein